MWKHYTCNGVPPSPFHYIKLRKPPPLQFNEINVQLYGLWADKIQVHIDRSTNTGGG